MCVCVRVCVVLNAPAAGEVGEPIFDYNCNFLTLAWLPKSCSTGFRGGATTM